MTNPATLTQLAESLHQLRADLLQAEAEAEPILSQLRGTRRESTQNLIHYVSFREHDLRAIQGDLSDYGLSSLGRLEGQVLPHIEALLATITSMLEHTEREDAIDLDALGGDPLAENSENLLGEGSPNRNTRIMVTMPAEAATNHELIHDMVDAGMDVARINCAHDDQAAWANMITGIRNASAESARTCRVSMDLGGPKLRTGPLEPGPKVFKVRPERDSSGFVTTPAQVRITWNHTTDQAARTVEASTAVTDADGVAVIPASPSGDIAVRVGDKLRYTDARGRRRKLTVTSLVEQPGTSTATLECGKTVYWETGGTISVGAAGQLTVGELDPARQALFVRRGDTIHLLRSEEPQPATQSSPHRIGCTLPEAFRDAQPGQRILFDDGKISGTITRMTPDDIQVRVTHAGVDGIKLRAEKGINLPDTDLRIPALTEEDRAHLPFIAANADIVNVSFVRSADDVADLMNELEALDARHVGITLKIETESGFRALPQMLLEAAKWENVGVMIARGDLAVEVGFERLAEVQEEILWLCEAAHVPVIWATQVLDSLAKTGLPSRAEVTDAAMSRRAECVMLNKGPYIVAAIDALDDILIRMGGHVSKKRSLLRSLAAWKGSLEASTERALQTRQNSKQDPAA